MRENILPEQGRDRLLRFARYEKDAVAGQWKKENVIMLDSIKINVFMEGSFSVFSDGCLHQPIYGDICVLSPQKLHYGQIPASTHLDYYEIDVGLHAFDAIPDGRLLIGRLLETVTPRDAFARPDPQSRERVLALCRATEEDLARGDRALAYARLIELLALLQTLYATSNLLPGAAFSYHTARAVQYMEAHYGEPLSIEALAAQCRVSPSYLSRVFKKETGRGLHEYLNQYRILRATSLLETHSVTETAYLCGFSDCSHLISVFRRYMGLTPYQYQKETRNRQKRDE